MTFEPRTDLTKLLLTCCWHIQFPGKKKKRERIMLVNSQVARKPKTFKNQQVSSHGRIHLVVCVLPFPRIHNLKTTNKVFDIVHFPSHPTPPPWNTLFPWLPECQRPVLFFLPCWPLIPSPLLDSVLLWPLNTTILSFHTSTSSKLIF